MKATQVWKALGPVDAKSVARDPLLRWMVFYPLLISVVIRLGVPAVAAHLNVRFRFDLTPYYPLLMSFVLLMVPMLAGTVIGFLLLDQRDDQTLAALQVTPLTLTGYLLYRISTPILLSLVLTLIVFPVAGLVEIPLLPLVAASLSSAPLAPIYALALVAFAANKVQGFALTKAYGVLLIPLVIAYLVEPPLQWVFGVVPLYWPAKLLWLAHGGDPRYLLCLAFGALYHSLLVTVLLRRFNKTMHI